ncbi:hypothetical protein GCM10009608_56580 [Pseudonocardia alaniniphila]
MITGSGAVTAVDTAARFRSVIMKPGTSARPLVRLAARSGGVMITGSGSVTGAGAVARPQSLIMRPGWGAWEDGRPAREVGERPFVRQVGAAGRSFVYPVGPGGLMITGPGSATGFSWRPGAWTAS